jgi:hypothetical protein
MKQPSVKSRDIASSTSATPSYDQLLYALQMAPLIRYVPERQYEKWKRDICDRALNGTLEVPK